MTIRTSGELTPFIAEAPRPEIESATEALFALGPNNTDFSIFAQAGWKGVDTATVGGSWSYHTPADDLTRLSPGSLQHMGDSTLALTRDLLDAELAVVDREPDALPTTVPWGLLAFPSWSVVALAVAALLAACVAIAWRRARGELSLRGTLAGSGLALLVVLGAALAATACWEGARAVDPGRASLVVGEPAVPVPYLVAELLAAVAVFVVVDRLGHRRPGASALAHGGFLLVAALTLLGALLLPAIVTWLLLPVLVASIGLLLTVPLTGARATVAITAALLPAAWMSGAQLSGVFDTGVGQGAPILGGSAGLLLVLVAGPMLARRRRSPHAQGGTRGAATASRPRSRRRALAAAVGLVAAAVAVPAAATGVAMALDASPTVARQEAARVRIDPATAIATWETTGRTPWGIGRHGLTAPADPSAFPAPTITVVSDRVTDTGRHITLRPASTRRAPTMRLEVGGARLVAVSVDGVPAPATHGSVVHLAGLRDMPVEVSLTLTEVEDVLVLDLTDHTQDVEAAPGFESPPAGVLLVDPDVSVSTRLRLRGVAP